MSQKKFAGKLFVLSGPSGAGKGTICNQLLKETDIALSVSMTTRNPRQGEIDGISYYFVTEEAFLKNIAEDGFLEYAQVYGNYYGTPKEPVLRQLAAGTDVILEIDMQGALRVKENFPDGVFLFILPQMCIRDRCGNNRGSLVFYCTFHVWGKSGNRKSLSGTGICVPALK